MTNENIAQSFIKNLSSCFKDDKFFLYEDMIITDCSNLKLIEYKENKNITYNTDYLELSSIQFLTGIMGNYSDVNNELKVFELKIEYRLPDNEIKIFPIKFNFNTCIIDFKSLYDSLYDDLRNLKLNEKIVINSIYYLNDIKSQIDVVHVNDTMVIDMVERLNIDINNRLIHSIIQQTLIQVIKDLYKLNQIIIIKDINYGNK